MNNTLFDCHTHSLHSHDSSALIDEMCLSAIDKGLSGIAITDHCDCEYAVRDDVFAKIKSSFIDTEKSAVKFKKKLTVMKGIEIGDMLFNESFAEKIIRAFDYDTVLLSVHAVKYRKNSDPFSAIDFTEWTGDEIDEYINNYFLDLYESVNKTDFDVLAHLTVPVRYIVYKYHKKVDLKKYYEIIETVLKKIISEEKTLEINTQGATGDHAYFLPDSEIIDLYISLGGRDFTLGSDAHSPQYVANGLYKGKELLLSKGIKEVCFYKNRKKQKYLID